MIFESHAHYDDKAFDEDRDELLPKLGEKGIGTVINVSSDLPSVRRTLDLAEKYPFIYAAVGIHPSDTGELDEEKRFWLWARSGLIITGIMWRGMCRKNGLRGSSHWRMR